MLPTSVTTASDPASSRTTVAPRWSGGTATTTSCTGDPSYGRPAPRPDAVRTFSGERSESSTSRPLARQASATEVPSRPAPTTCTGPARASGTAGVRVVGDRAHPGQVAAQVGGAVQ